MRPKRGIAVTVFLFALIFVVFAALTLFLPGPGEDEAPTIPTTSGTDSSQTGLANNTLSEAEFVAWLGEARENITSLVGQIKAAGMDMKMSQAQAYGDQLLNMSRSYLSTLENATVPASLQNAQTEYLAALEDYRTAAVYGKDGAADMDMDKIGTAMEYFQRASAHSDSAFKELEGQV
jgi:hypothetical protein